jgi:hypothetical protein
MWWLVIKMWKQYQPQSRKQSGSNLNHKAGSKVEAKWIQTGCKVDAKWMQSGCKVDAKAWNMLEGMVYHWGINAIG